MLGYIVVCLLQTLTTSSPQTKLVSLVPANPIDPVQYWVWGKLGNGQVYIATQTWGGTGITKKADVPFTEEEEEVELGIDVDFSPKEGSEAPTWSTSGAEGGAPAWPVKPVVENNYEAKGQMIKLDDTMKGYLVGSGEKVIIWSTDTTGITDEKIDSKGTKEWADFLAEEGGYTVLIPDWFRGNNQPEGGFGTDTMITWSKEVTNWTKIESDWKNAVLPYLETKLSAPLSIGLIGTCWGSYPVVFLSRFNNIKCGISMHPSHPGLIALAGQDESEVLSQIVAPQLFMSEGISFLPTGLPPSLYAGGLADQILGDKITIEKFDDMMHGWTVGGDLSNPNVAKGVEKAKKLALEFFAKHL